VWPGEGRRALRVQPAAELSPRSPQIKTGLTVLVPAYNEAASIADTIHSLKAQSLPIDEIIVIDDFSSDDTGDVARRLGVTVLRPPQNTGSKAGAQNFALSYVTTGFTMAIDADTVLARDAIEQLMSAMDDPAIAAASGFVLPRHVKTLWERGRYIEYLFAFSFYKCIQDYYERPLISSGCFFDLPDRRAQGQRRLEQAHAGRGHGLDVEFLPVGHGVRFVPEAVCYRLNRPIIIS